VGTLLQKFDGAFETGSVGDPIVLYDQLADRWVVTQIAEAPAAK